MRLFTLILGLLVVGACHPCNRDPKVWVTGLILVTFKEGITTAEATAIVTRLGYVYSEVASGLGNATVPPGEECLAEDRLMAEPGVDIAAQDLRVSVNR